MKALRAELVGAAPAPRVRAKAIATPHDWALPPASRSDRTTLTLLNGIDAGHTFTIETSVIVGRDETVEVCIRDDAVSRRHACISRRSDGSFLLEDLESTNGTFVDAVPIKARVLSSGVRIHLGPRVALRFATTDETEDTMQRRLYDSSTRDALTAAFNRAALAERLLSEVAFTRRNGSPLWLLMLDLDHFKLVNDAYGHLVGDQMLREVAHCATSMLRCEDVFARFGGEEFVVLTRDADRRAAFALAERLRCALGAVAVKVGADGVSTTVSIGGAALSECAPPTGEALLALADRRMYAAKTAGRNAACLEG
jgi:two-component system cell cycle response regulator